jgi:hypothetical protein
MLDILDNYLNDVATPEQALSVRNACAIFEEVNDLEYEGKYEEYLMIDDNADAGATLEAILDYTRVRCIALLERFGVEASEECYLSHLVRYLRVLLLLPDNEAREEILRIAGQDGSNLDRFAELVEFQDGYSASLVLTEITVVDQNVIPNLLIEMSKTDTIIELDEGESRRAKRARRDQYLSFVQFSKIRQLRLATLLHRGLDADYPLDVYLNMLQGEFDELDPQSIAAEMVACAFLSSDAHTNPLVVLRAKLDKYISDIDKVTKVDTEIRHYIQTFTGSPVYTSTASH